MDEYLPSRKLIRVKYSLCYKNSFDNLSVLGYRQLFLVDDFFSSTSLCD